MAKNIITHCPKYCYFRSLKRFNAEEALVMQNMRANKKGQVPGTSKKKEEE